jgi:hypothetical protein
MLRSSRVYAAIALALGLTLGGTANDAWARGKKKPPPTKPVKVVKKPVAAPGPTAEQKKAMAELMGAYTWGMSKDEIVGQLTKQIDERYAEQIKATSDVFTQDKLRKEKQKELSRVKQSLIEFDGKKSGWDVSLIDEEFAHNTGESMLVYWENEGGKNQRRFFFFFEGKLWKMFIAFDTKQLAPESRNFQFFRTMLEARYGQAKVEPKVASWATSDFEVRAIDKMAFYGALGLAIHNPAMVATVTEIRVARAPAAAGKDNIIEIIRQKGDASDTVNLDENNDAVDAIIRGSK